MSMVITLIEKKVIPVAYYGERPQDAMWDPQAKGFEEFSVIKLTYTVN
jgi:hypothetical protein